ncbi:MAG: RHS repeat-associated core domain-containing protein, partial [Gemmatimonadota bacterium]
MSDPIRGDRGEWFRGVCRLLCGLLLLQSSEVPALALVAQRDGAGLPTVERLVEEAGGVLARVGGEVAAGVAGLDRRLRQGLQQEDPAPAGAPTPDHAPAQPRVLVAGSGPGSDGEHPGQLPPLTDHLSGPTERALPQAPPGVPARPPSPPAASAPAPVAAPAGAVDLVPRGTVAPRQTSLDEVVLVAGLNLSSLPKEPPDPSPSAVFAPIAGQTSAVYAYDACDAADPWKVWDPADPAGSDLGAVDHTDGLWIAATAGTTLPVEGTQPPTTEIPLCAGWNLVGYPLAQARAPEVALASIADRLVRVFGYEAADPADPWEVYDPAVPVWASDLTLMQPGRGYWVLVSADATLRYSNEGPPPEVDLLAPADLAEVTAPTEVTGTVTSDLLEGWSLGYRPAGEAAPFTEIASGTTPVTGATLGTFDPTLLLNGLYELRLRATDFAGQVIDDTIAVSVDGQQKVGNFTLSFTDLDVPVSGLPIRVIRTYDSRDKRQRDFGVGWSLDVRQGSYSNNRPPGEGWRIASGFLPCQTVQETLSHLTSIRISEREIYRFRLRVTSPAPTLGGCFARASFAFVDGPVPGASLAILGNTDVLWQNGSDGLVDVDTFEPYQPEDVRLTTPDGRVFDLDLADGVTRLADPNGNALTISDAGITHSSGESIVFERDGAGRIERILDPMGRALEYRYDGAGDLVAFTDREEATSRYTYDSRHGLLEIEDPRGVTPIRSEYDDDGRLVRHTDAFGNTITFDHDLAARREVITDRTGASRVLEYDARGNVVREVDEDGDEVLRTYDAADNLLTQTDPLGNTTTYTYDAANNETSVTDALGNTTSRTFDAGGRVLTETDPNGGVTTNSYDAAGNLLSTTDPLGHVTSFTYDARGNVLTETDAAGGVTTFEYDASGNVTRQVDPLGAETTYTYDGAGNRLSESAVRTLADGTTETLTTSYTYDAEGRLVATTDPTGATTRTEYDALGNIRATVDPLGRTTTFTYDSMGRLDATAYPDGTTESQSYDAEGRVLTRTDRAGRITRLAYDAQGRLVSTTFPDGATVTSTYDAGGRLISRLDPRSNETTYEYDDAGRRTKVIDALGQATTVGYDAVGNQVSMTDPLGSTTTFEYDAAGQQVRTVHADGTASSVEYDALGRRVAETDPAGNTTRFTYDARDQLLTVADALGQVTRFTYDELGNRLTQTDANGHTTTFAYDGAGRQTGRTLPDGSSETTAYDPAGNLTARTDFAGRTTSFAYDAENRLVSKTLPGGAVVTYTYTATGQRESVTDARGTTSYAYDARDRLTSLTYPDGRRLVYGHDPAGNRVSLTAELAAETLTTTFTYDALNRLDTVTDPDGRAYVHGYDANGNRSALSYPNGVATSYGYDARNRLTDLTSTAAGGTVIQSYGYTLGAAGNRTAVSEHDGTVRTYSYDALFRLTAEQVSGGPGPAFEDAFGYDPVGNRLTREHTEGGVTTTSASTYDVRDRLLTEGVVTRTWDANGNLTATDGPDGATYTWDAENRLTRVETVDGEVITHAYDADGNRVRTEITPATGPPTVTDYLVDPSGGLSHAVAETDDTGALTAYYVRGDDLLAVIRPATGARFYHADGLGSIRALTDDTGAVTDRYTFSAFGELLDHQGTDPNAYLFAGEPLDPNSGFYYLRARWMDPGTGRFVSMDPFAGLAHEPITLHKYLYANLDPVDVVDPSGRFGTSSFGSLAISLAVRATLFTMRHPALTTVLGFVFSILIPEEFSNALLASGNPYGVSLGAGGRARARFFAFVKSARFRRFIQRNLSAAGRAGREIGRRFEVFLARDLFRGGAQRQIPLPGRRSVDFFFRGLFVEAKTSRSLGARELRQLEAIASEARSTGFGFTYLFLNRPTPGA